MKLRINVCNRCPLVCVKFYLNWIRFAVVIAKCLGGSLFFGTQVRVKVPSSPEHRLKSDLSPSPGPECTTLVSY